LTGIDVLNRKRTDLPQGTAGVRVKALFTDYDGTISPINVSRSDSVVPSKIMTFLCEISLRIPVVVVTTKDLSFVVKRTPFAHAWAALGGLEMRVNGVTTSEACLESKTQEIAEAQSFARNLAENDLVIEEKQNSEGAPVAFSVDWRQTGNVDAANAKGSKITAYCDTLSLSVTKYEGQPFFDVFPCPINKGKALLILKKKFGLQDGILYMGDSGTDNAAFEKADIAVGVLHEETPDSLFCRYFVKTEELATFLQGILENNFHFNAKPPVVLDRKEAMQYLQQRKHMKKCI
jgi:HAD superfamily hydrolase (TIGR01484 family)